MIEELLKRIIVPVSKKVVDSMVDEAMERVNRDANMIMDRMSEKADEITVRCAHIIKELVPPIVFSALFLGAGVLILVLGASTYIDSIVMIEGAGFMLGGLVLILLGGYYKMQLEKAMEKIKEL